MKETLKALETLELLKVFVLKNFESPLDRMFVSGSFDILEKELKAFSILKECLTCEYRIYDEDGKHYIQLYFDELHQLTFNLKEGESELLKEALE